MEKVRVLVVDDSAFMRKLIQDILDSSKLIEVAGTARNGVEAIKKIKDLQPDAVTLDVEMPVLDGLEALKIIMKECPVPVVMLSSTTRVGEENTLKAIQNGAVDFVAKPSGSISLDLQKVSTELIDKVLAASKANLKSLTRKIIEPISSSIPNLNYSKIKPDGISNLYNKPGDMKSSRNKLILIGTSTGGPRALQEVLTRMPASLSAPILIVQHMPAGFTRSLANRLNTLCSIKVKEAEEGEVLEKGTAYIAPGGFHLEVKRKGSALNVHLSELPPVNGHRPSVDVMFESASRIEGYTFVTAILTGMGSDGVNGLRTLKLSGGTKSIAESQETSVVFGMPKAAIAAELIDEIHSIDKVSDAIMKFVNPEG